MENRDKFLKSQETSVPPLTIVKTLDFGNPFLVTGSSHKRNPLMTSTTIDRTDTLGQIAAAFPETVAVFLQHDLDFCCGGKQTLEAACAVAKVNETELLGELIKTAENVDDTGKVWTDQPLPELIDHIISAYHEPLRTLLPTLEILAKRVEMAHGPNHGPALTTLRETVQGLKAELLRHLEDEESRLFPMIRSNEAGKIAETLDELIADHLEVAATLEKFHELTGNYTLPESACETWRALWWNLQKLETDLKKHIHLENNVLFPGALKSD
jgi:regulator of cell morphogenesis and NO signaling